MEHRGPMVGGRFGPGRRGIARLGAVLLPVVLVGAMCFAARASAASCSSGGGDSPPEGRPYWSGSTSMEPSVRKYFALTTVNADGIRTRCECVEPRPWAHGLAAQARVAAMRAMDGKEALAIYNYGRFGVPPERVPVQARTIWMRATWRSHEEQVCLRNVFGSGAARPGTSKHELGIAIDIEDWGPQHGGVDAGFLRANGWCRTVSSEPWHYEYRPLLESMGLGGRCIK